MKRRIALLALLAGALALVPGDAGAQGPVVVAGPGAFLTNYATPVVAAQVGGELTFVSLDLDKHNVVQDVAADGVHGPDTSPWCGDFPSGACPLFWSDFVRITTRTAPVEGLSNLEAGKVYSFYCTEHTNMKGKLIALPEGP